MVQQRIYDLINDNVAVLYDRMFPLYILKGSKNFLIDTGSITRARGFYDNINKVLVEINAHVPGIQTLLLTHTHWDHVGSSSFLQKKYGFDVVCSHRGVDLLKKESVIRYINRLNQDHKKLENDASDTVFDGLENIEGVKDGDKIEIDETCYLEVLETPGHTKCSVSYYLQPWKVLFCGDSTGVTEQTGVLRPLFLSSYTDYENSLKKLCGLDIEVLAFPHNRYINDKEKIREYMDLALWRLYEIRDKILLNLKAGKEVSEIAEILYLSEFTKPTVMGPREALMTNLEAMIKSVQKECMGE